MLSAPHFVNPMRAVAARAKPWASVLTDERSIVLALAAVAAVAHALNMFNYPSWATASQEGITVYRAWALLQNWELWGDLLSPSTAATLLVAGWLAATGGPHGFGSITDGGRMLMLALHVGMVPLLFGLARLLGCRVLAAALATALFALSPLVIAHQRLVVPDNFVSFWALLSVYLMLRSHASWGLKGLAVACVGLAFLSSGASGRGNATPATGLQIQQLVATLNDPFLALGGAAVVANLSRGLRDLRVLLVGIAGALPLLRIVIEGGPSNPAFELAIPFCLNVGFALTPVLDRIPRALGGAVTASVVAVFMVQYAVTGAFQALYLERPVAAEREALVWTRSHVPPQSTIAADPWALAELEDATSDGIAFTGLRLRDWRSPDVAEYTLIALDSGSALRLTFDRLNPPPPTVSQEGLVKRWVADGTHVELRKARGPGATEDVLLAGSAQYLTRRFERAGAYVALDGSVTAQSQANGMLRAAWSGDREAFMRAWRWTASNLANADGLLASTWRNGAVVSAETATDADTDAALALLMASRRWTDEELLLAARRMVDAIWRREVVLVNGLPYAVAGDWAREPAILALTPGGFAPYAYETFASVDPGHDWAGVVESGYRVLAAASASGSVGLPPDWIGLDRATGGLTTLPLAGRDTMRYGDDAARTYWRVALHHLWSRDARAERFLRSATFLRDEVARRGAPARSYSPDGRMLDAYPSGPGTAAALAALLTVDPVAAQSLYASQVVGAASRLGAGVYWGDLNDLGGQEWGWLATALYANRVPDLWRSSPGRSVAEGAS